MGEGRWQSQPRQGVKTAQSRVRLPPNCHDLEPENRRILRPRGEAATWCDHHQPAMQGLSSREFLARLPVRAPAIGFWKIPRPPCGISTDVCVLYPGIAVSKVRSLLYEPTASRERPLVKEKRSD